MKKHIDEDNNLHISFGSLAIILKDKYQLVYTINDILIGLLFLLGTIFNMLLEWKVLGAVMYICGSVLLLIRPAIRICRLLGVRRLNKEKTWR
ncbi:YrhK family protein [Niallia taxi]|uniref:YrhK family protein n=1 Tax=Niallia taxi TaxID=2499688 RepID=UPI0011A4D189|nr:YrhK family protein [Niallia taxi]MCT2344634.1 YrhK family protein [Niallia taxi]MDE5053553.1 YrhK family protein [Niallia taxi]MED3961775.1 YrhK family protein [Niallia taxi]WOD61108.1 YrhK family protein [Niallia taxi]